MVWGDDVQAASFDLGEVEDVVDEVKQVLAAAEDGVEAGGVVFVDGVSVFENFGVAKDGVERGAQFVAHVGEERALGFAGGFGGVSGFAALARPCSVRSDQAQRRVRCRGSRP